MLNPCSFCSAECCKTYVITTTIFDLIRIANATTKPIESFALFHEPRLLSYDPDMVLDTDDGFGRYLLGLKSHPCIFLDTKTNRCVIHKAAPLSCKRYPYQINGQINSRFCAVLSGLLFRFHSPDIDTKQLARELELHKKFVKMWNKKKGTKNQCMEFLFKQTKNLENNEE